MCPWWSSVLVFTNIWWKYLVTYLVNIILFSPASRCLCPASFWCWECEELVDDSCMYSLKSIRARGEEKIRDGSFFHYVLMEKEIKLFGIKLKYNFVNKVKMSTMRSTLLVRQIQLGKRLTAVRAAWAAGLHHEIFILDLWTLFTKLYF